MRKATVLLGALCAVVMLAWTPSAALGPVDGEFGFVYWAHDFDAEAGGASNPVDAGSTNMHAELWLFNRWGARAGVYSSDIEELGANEVEYMNLDLMAKVIKPTDNTFLAVGLGYESIDFGGDSEETSGVRVVAQGSVGLIGMLKAYGHIAYFPSMGDVDGAKDISGHEYDVGVAIDPFPFLTFRAGYRDTSLSYDSVLFIPATGVDTTSEGFYIGAGYHF